MNRYLKDLSNKRKLRQWLKDKAKEDTTSMWGNGYARAVADMQLVLEGLDAEHVTAPVDIDIQPIVSEPYIFSK